MSDRPDRTPSEDREPQEVARSVEREADEAATLPRPADDQLPPGHPAHDDDTFSVGETVSRGSLPGRAGRPGRAGDADVG